VSTAWRESGGWGRAYGKSYEWRGLAAANGRALPVVHRLQHKQGARRGAPKATPAWHSKCVYKEKCHGVKKLLKAKGWRRMRCMCLFA